MKQHNIFDLSKYVLALMVVAIHTGFLSKFLFPWLRIAVPLFFIISSYLLFSRIKNDDESKEPEYIKKYVLRNISYYVLWFLLLLPYTVIARKEWLDSGILSFIRTAVTHLLFGDTFSASWFIIAAVWAVLFLHLTRKVSPKILTPIVIVLYLLCCLRTSYYFLVKDTAAASVFSYYELIFTNPANSFPAAIFWMFIGKQFADRKDAVFNKKFAVLGAAVSAIGLWFEANLLTKNISADCFIFLIPLAICLFTLIKDTDINLKKAKTFRTISIIMYPLHASLTGATRVVLTSFIAEHYEWLLFLIVVIGCHLATFIILRLEKVKPFGFLKYSH
ncbi:MAG: acyltransferase [Butyrivibrio sp.]|nr:acyltransferase [Butyrivibrio sp.]